MSTVDLPGAQQSSFNTLTKNHETVKNMDSVGKMTVQMFYLKQLYNPDSELFSHLENVYRNIEDTNAEDGDAQDEKQRQQFG